jgi:hypothetical protein
VTLDVSGHASVHVRLIAPEGESLPPELFLVVRQDGRGETYVWMQNFLGEEETTLHGLPAGSYQLLIQDGPLVTNEKLVTRMVALAPGEERAFEFRLGENTRRFRVVDSEGAPLSGVTAIASQPGRKEWWGSVMRTDQDGVFELVDYEEDEVVLSLSHPTAGHRLGFTQQVPEPGESTDLTLDGTVSVTFVVRDVNGPIVGVSPVLRDRGEQLDLSTNFTDANGEITWDLLTEGTYLFVLDEPGYWLTAKKIEVVPGCGPFEVLASRRADLHVRALTDGLPRPDVTVELTWLRQDLTVAEFVQWGFAKSSSPELRTGADGTLDLTGIPEGDYTWRATSSTGTSTGRAAVSPDGDPELVIAVP